MFDLEKIFNQFRAEGEFVVARELGVGHINDTFLVKSTGRTDFVLQRINHVVFPNVPELVENKVLISRHLREKLAHLDADELEKRVLTFVRTNSGGDYYLDDDGNYWNLTVYINGSVIYARVTSNKVAFEAGKLFGEFLFLTRDFDSSKLKEVIPDFHKMSSRLGQFDRALSAAAPERIRLALESIEFADQSREEMLRLERLIDQGLIPIRATHNDTKISNAVFSENDQALCVIDTDTVMPGAIHFDFGDAVRTICSTADEDEPDLAKVLFDLGFFESFASGFIGSLGDGISDLEAEYLAFSAKMMTFIVGLRMLTDFLENDTYFKTSRENHNLDRARNQFRLAQEMEKNMDEMVEIIRSERAKTFEPVTP